MDNSLISVNPLPHFNRIKPDEIEPTIRELIKNARNVINETLEKNKKDITWDSLVTPIEEADDKLNIAWGIVSSLNSVVSTPELRNAHDNMLAELSEYSTWVGQNHDLYEAYLNLKNSDEFHLLSFAQRRAVDLELRDFKLSGIALDEKEKKEFAEIVKSESKLVSTFTNNVLDATNSWVKHITDKSLLSGLPDSALKLAKEEAVVRKLDGWVLTLKFPSYFPVMKYADSRKLRQEIYTAYVTRASDQGCDAGKFDNGPIIDEELKLSEKQAHLLGFKTYADLSLADKMAESPEEVLNFLNDLVNKSKKQALGEVNEIVEYAHLLGVDYTLMPWDMSYYGEKLKQKKYSISDEKIRPYFPLPKVLKGLFQLVNKIFGIEVRPHLGVDVWNKDVQYFDVYDEKRTKRGGIYFDLYARDNKNGGAWMDSCLSRHWMSDGSLQLPVSYVICNFIPPLNGKPALLNHEEVETLFHEFGHNLHHVMTTVDVESVAGINQVPWDAVEVPSQFMENFTWQPEVLSMISGHVDTGEPLPEDLLNKLISSKNYHSALAMLRQLEFSIFDFRLFHEYGNGMSVQDFLNDVRTKVSVLPNVPFDRFQDSFTHIFAGGYSAGYYSYKWAEVLSADIFSRFEEEGILNSDTGKSYLHMILENGGSKDFMQMFIDFRGRKPSIEPLLRHSGIKIE